MTLGEIIIANPILSLAIISLVVTFISSLAQKWLTNQEHLKNLKKRQKEIQKELKNCKDECKLKELNAEILSITGLMFKSSLKPLIATAVPFLILFTWLRAFYQPLLGGWWILYYIIFSLVSSIILRKVLDIA
ncbi:MAG: EMC3/TMCO1 family protein [Nanoarchaeota archaeon]|nr:EMC3/TMCO1 family protein [Nanoarchaeota archaeon]